MLAQFNSVRFVASVGETTDCLFPSVTQMLLTPGVITMTIASTRMHRSLVDYASGFPDVYDTLNLLHFLFCSNAGNIISGLAQGKMLNYQWTATHSRRPYGPGSHRIL